MGYEPLTRDEVCAVIEGHGGSRRIPVMIHFWTDPGEDPRRRDAVSSILNRYPVDVQVLPLNIPQIYDAPPDEPGYRWVSLRRSPTGSGGALDAQVAIANWRALDEVLANFPDPCSPHLLPPNAPADGRYRLGHWWFWLFERHWSLRGMQNALLDYYTNPEEVKRLYRALTDFYLIILERGKKELGLDGIFTSDDLGAQTGPMFSPAVFVEFFKPFYAELVTRAHQLGMHFWLHACGNIEPFLPHLVEIGLDVLHPVQKYTMDERRIAARFGDMLCIWAGFDVQQIIPWGTPEQVRAEVHHLVDTYQKPGGRLILGAGNMIHDDCPLESLAALCAEMFGYQPARAHPR
jgi:uroporphyrinogen decarboxylase